MENQSQQQGILTADDYLEEQRELELKAASVLPGRIDQCSRPLGKIRQAIYACLTCKASVGQEMGCCYACSVSCHTKHDLVEVGVRRAFLCDCGAGRMSTCQVQPVIEKDWKAENVENNAYNQNFSGKFCL